MAVSISIDGDELVVSIGGIKRLTLSKGLVTVTIDGNYVMINHNGHYQTKFLYSDVTSPSGANAEAVRAAIISLMQ